MLVCVNGWKCILWLPSVSVMSTGCLLRPYNIMKASAELQVSLVQDVQSQKKKTYFFCQSFCFRFGYIFFFNLIFCSSQTCSWFRFVHTLLCFNSSCRVPGFSLLCQHYCLFLIKSLDTIDCLDCFLYQRSFNCLLITV